jgi:hypothetical protein
MVDVSVGVKKRGSEKRKFWLSKDPECGILETPLRQCMKSTSKISPTPTIYLFSRSHCIQTLHI